MFVARSTALEGALEGHRTKDSRSRSAKPNASGERLLHRVFDDCYSQHQYEWLLRELLGQFMNNPG